nr:reverse transcriptase domain-containing protein [Tanacetum cinerariifolium]
MSTHSSASNLFPPLDNPELTIRKRTRVDPTLLNEFGMATDRNGDPPIPDLRTMEELCQPTLNGRGRPIALIPIQATNFGLKNAMIQQVQNSCQLHGLPSDDANKHLDKFLHVTQSIKVNGVTDDALHLKEITNFRQCPDESLFEARERYKLSIDHCLNHNMLPITQIDTFYNGLTLRHRDTINVAAGGTFMKRRPEECYDLIENITAHHNDWDTSAQRILQVNQQVKAVANNCETCGGPHSYNDCPATVGQTQNVYAAGAYQGDLNFNISFADALILMPKFGSTIKSLMTNKDKLYELARTPLNEHCSTVLLKKLLEKLGDPGKFLIPCDFLGMDECLALADLDASIHLMPLSVWNKLSLPELSPTCMTLELADHSISRLIGVAEDVFVNVGTFHFPADFEVVDFDADPRVPLILGRSFLKTGRALIDVYAKEFTLRVNNEAVTFNLDQTSRYLANYNDMTTYRIDVIDMSCEEYSQEVLGFSDVIASGNPTPYYGPIISSSSLTLTPFRDRDFLLEEVDAFLALEDDPTLPEVDHSYYDTDVDILLLEAFLNDDPSLPPPTQGMYLHQIQKELKICEAKDDKSLIDESPEVELKDLPPHLEYAFLEGDDKLPIIIAKDLSVEEKAALIKVLKSHKRANAWKLSEIKAVQQQRRANPKIHDVIKKEVEKILDAGLIYPISDSPWVSLVHYVPKMGGFTIVENEENELIPTRLVIGWRVCINYQYVEAFQTLKRKLTEASILIVLDWDLPFELMCDASDFAIEYVEAFQTLKRKLTETSILIVLDWDLPFELMCDASDFSIGAVLGKRHEKHFRDIHYASKTMTEAESHYTTTEKEMLAVVYAFEKFWSYLIFNKSIVYTDHSALKYLFAKKIPRRDCSGGFSSFKSLNSKCEALLLGRPLLVISDRGLHFYNDQFVKVMLKYGVTHRLATVYHPQTSGQVEVSNRGLKRILERTVGENHASWSDNLDNTLWAFRTAFKTPIECIPYKFVYGKACHLLIKLEHKAYWALKHANFDLLTAGDHRKVQINELNELCDQAYENSLIYKEKTKRLHDSKIKDRVFNIGDRVLLFNSRLNIFSGKLKTAGLDHSLSPKCSHMALSSYPKPTRQISRTIEFEDWVKLSDLKQALRGRHPMLIIVVTRAQGFVLRSLDPFPQLH